MSNYLDSIGNFPPGMTGIDDYDDADIIWQQFLEQPDIDILKFIMDNFDDKTIHEILLKDFGPLLFDELVVDTANNRNNEASSIEEYEEYEKFWQQPVSQIIIEIEKRTCIEVIVNALIHYLGNEIREKL